ncbi:MAG: leucine-rich repeat domain-containing protein [Lachnospiraceae bacterium]|nr:leucine-rich repeat domain-containing protein [Lachnospiraceae bacterium]
MKKQDEEAVATAVSIAGEEVSIEDFRTQINNDSTIEIDLYTGHASTVVIPDMLVEIGECAFYSIDLKKLAFPKSISKIGGGAFCRLNITTLTVPGSLKVIEEQTFESCEQLKEVIIEDGVEVIEKAFKYCIALEKVTIPSSVTEIEPNAFKGCKQVTIIAEAGSYAETFANEKGIPVQNP